MFRNKDQEQELLAKEKSPRNPEPRTSQPPTLIAAGASFNGDLKTPGATVIEGTVEGTILAEGDVQVGNKGTVTAEVEGRNITVAGKIKGKIFADDKVVLLAGSKVEGDIHSQSLKIEDSVFFQGGCVMGEGARKRRSDQHIPLPQTVKKTA
jgi:cytoskeletal protein CcmA (bactofilin family)